MEKPHPEVVEALCDGDVPLCQRFEALRNEDLHVADEICAMRVLTEVVEHFSGSTMMEINSLLETQVSILKERFPECPGVASGTELFLKFALRLKGDATEGPGEVQAKLVERGRKFISRLQKSRETIGGLAVPFFRDGCTVLVHGYSRVVLAVIRIAHERGRIFNVVCTESRPDSMGFRMATEINRIGIPAMVILDSAAAAVMDHIDFVLCGSQVICESGGIINKIGTYQLSLVAKEFGKPFYVAAESFKFQRLYPLCQADVKQSSGTYQFSDLAPRFLFNSLAGRSVDATPRYPMNRSAPAVPIVAATIQRPQSTPEEDDTVKPTPNRKMSKELPPLDCFSAHRRTWSTLSTDLNTLPEIEVSEPLSSDYTDPAHITLLFTDFGVLTPSVVSDELLRIFS